MYIYNVYLLTLLVYIYKLLQYSMYILMINTFSRLVVGVFKKQCLKVKEDANQTLACMPEL